MSHNAISSKGIKWWHFSSLEEKDIAKLEETFKFHPLDFDDLRSEDELTKVDVYKYYLFCIVNIPTFHIKTGRVMKENLAIFVGKDYVVTVSKKPIKSLERFFAKAKRSSGLKRDLFGHTTGYLLYKILDYVFKDAKIVLRELVKETHKVEDQVYDRHTRVTTARLGVLRRNILFMGHIVRPVSIFIDQIKNARKPFIPNTVDIYFDDVKDTLDGMSVVIENVRNIVDGLFDVNEAFLSHKTNEIIRILTIISVVLMPPTLITSYYGMNVQALPLSENVWVISGIILVSIFGFWAFIKYIDHKNR